MSALIRILPLVGCLCVGLAGDLPAAPRPNIIFILTDDLGYGDLGVFYQNARRAEGKPAFHTPHLDTMAEEGAMLTRHYCPAPVCAPSRASLLLGVHQGHANIRDNQFDKVLENNHTLGTVLQGAGYKTAVIGKWGVQGGPEKAGDPSSPSFPTKRGFDFFFGYLDHSAGHRHYPKENPVDAGDPDGQNTVWEMETDVTQKLDKCYSTDLWTARAKKWIVDQRAQSPDQPFFLYLAYTAPHSALTVPTMAYPSYATGSLSGGIQWTGTTGAMINTAGGTIDTYIHPDYSSQSGWSNANKRHATMVRRVDDAVGDVLQLLKNLNIDNNTLVVFTSDNGPHNEPSYTGVAQDPQFFRSYANMDGIKRDTWEAGIREPTLVRWPSVIPAGRTSDHVSQFHDWMPTFAEWAGVLAPARSDGVSLVPALTGSGVQRAGVTYIEYNVSGTTPTYPDFTAAHRGATRNQEQVIFLNGYKGIRYNASSHAVNFTIYDPATDPQETTALTAGTGGVPTQQEFKDAVLRVRRPNSTAARPYDSEYVPPLTPAPVHPGVAWRAFEGEYPWVPSFAGIAESASGETTRPDLAVRTRDNNIGIEFKGYLQVPADAAYTFYLTTDTGAFLRLHDMQVLDADFTYTGGTEVSASVNLKAGKHPFTLGYRRLAAGTPALSLSWSSASIAKQVIPDSAFYIDGEAPPVPPTANPDASSTTGSHTGAGASVLIDVLANDTDDGSPSPLAIIGVTTPVGGTAAIESGKIRYTPRQGFFGTDAFEYTISDGGDSDSAVVTVEVCAAGTILWLPFDETSGATAYDAGGRALGALSGFADTTSCWVPGHWGGALDFDGANDKVVLAGEKGILGTAARTIVFWINADATQTSGARPTMVSWGAVNGTAYGARCDANLDHSNGYRLRAEFNGGGMNFSTATRSDLRGAGWVHCAIVIPANARFIDVLGYLDGVPATGTYVGGQPSTTAVNTTTGGDVTIGNIHDTSALRCYAGLLDDVRIYPRALTAGEIAALAGQAADEDFRALWSYRYGGSDMPSETDWATDVDRDGIPAFLEFALGGNPTLPSQGITPRLDVAMGGFAFVFNRRQEGIAAGAYIPEYSETLAAASWAALTATPGVAPHPDLAGFDLVSVALPETSSPRGFVRLRVAP